MVSPAQPPIYLLNAFSNQLDQVSTNTGGGGGSPQPGGVVGWTDVTSASMAMAVNNGYTANNPSTRINFSLPPTCPYGRVFKICGKNTGGWIVTQNANQTIHIGNQNTTTGITGSVASTNQYDAISLLCTVENTDFTAYDPPQGNLTIT